MFRRQQWNRKSLLRTHRRRTTAHDREGQIERGLLFPGPDQRLQLLCPRPGDWYWDDFEAGSTFISSWSPLLSRDFPNFRNLHNNSLRVYCMLSRQLEGNGTFPSPGTTVTISRIRIFWTWPGTSLLHQKQRCAGPSWSAFPCLPRCSGRANTTRPKNRDRLLDECPAGDRQIRSRSSSGDGVHHSERTGRRRRLLQQSGTGPLSGGARWRKWQPSSRKKLLASWPAWPPTTTRTFP